MSKPGFEGCEASWLLKKPTHEKKNGGDQLWVESPNWYVNFSEKWTTQSHLALDSDISPKTRPWWPFSIASSRFFFLPLFHLINGSTERLKQKKRSYIALSVTAWSSALSWLSAQHLPGTIRHLCFSDCRLLKNKPRDQATCKLTVQYPDPWGALE